jgi:UDP-2,3-diacylglucosamine pyrophosphatase LpxH
LPSSAICTSARGYSTISTPNSKDTSYRFWLGFGARREPAQLVINGDFFDFVQADPWAGSDLEASTADGIPLCFTELQSLDKLRAIQKAHRELFAALSEFLALREENRIVVLPGNHDADFFWPSVERQFTKVVCPPGREKQLQILLADSYRPEGCRWLWIEHGQQHDPVNSFFIGGEPRWSREKPPIFQAADGERRLYECIGTRFLIRFLNRLDARYPFVDNVKPFSRFVRIFGTSALLPGWGPLDAAISVGAMLKYLAATGLTSTSDLLGIEGSDGSPLPDPLAGWLSRATRRERQRLSAALAERGFSSGMPLDIALERPDDAERLRAFLANHLEILENLGDPDPSLLGASTGTLKLKAGFTANETEDLFAGAERVAAAHLDVTAVVMGHTHEPVDRPGRFYYFNTGSWTRYYRFTQDEKTAPWKLLRERSYERFPYRLLYVVVEPGATVAAMETWREKSKQ